MALARTRQAQPAYDRDLRTHLGRATTEVRAALAVCSQAVRRGSVMAEDPRVRMDRLRRAERVLASIGHLDGASEEPDLRQEARALCAWLESRERAAGVHRPSRRGQEYQGRLQAALGFLEGRDVSVAEEPKEEQQVKPEALPEPVAEGILWQRALDLARQQGEEGNDAYVLAIFRKLVGGVSNG